MFLFSEIVRVVCVRLDPFRSMEFATLCIRKSAQSKNCVINKVFVLSLHTAAPVAKSRNSNDIIS